MTTASCYREHTQEIAKIVTAFNAMFGTVCAVAKFRAVTTHEEGQEDLLIRNWKWEAIQVPFQDGKACVRTLGVKVNLSLDWSEQVQEVSHYLGRVATLVHGVKVKPHTKVATINMSVVLGMAYKSGGLVWPLGAIDKLDRQITRMTRVALGLTESFPYQLIRAKVGEFGIKSFSQIHRENTERIIPRCIAGPGPGHAAARGLANRAFRTKSNIDRGMGLRRQRSPTSYLTRIYRAYWFTPARHARRRGRGKGRQGAPTRDTWQQTWRWDRRWLVDPGQRHSIHLKTHRLEPGGSKEKASDRLAMDGQAEGCQSRGQGAPPGDHRGMESYTPAAVHERTCHPTQRRSVRRRDWDILCDR
jgi:hypothetical protein